MAMELVVRRWFVGLTLGMCIIVSGLGILAYYAFLQPPPLVYTQEELPILNPGKKVHRGDVLIVQVARTFRSEAKKSSYLVTRELHCDDQPSAGLLSGSVPVDRGYSEIQVKQTKIPNETALGWCFMDGVADVDGDLRHFKVYWRTERFEVVQ